MEKIQTILRRCARADKDSKIYVCKNLIVDFERRTVSKDGQMLTLTPTEFILQKSKQDPFKGASS